MGAEEVEAALLSLRRKNYYSEDLHDRDRKCRYVCLAKPEWSPDFQGDELSDVCSVVADDYVFVFQSK